MTAVFRVLGAMAAALLVIAVAIFGLDDGSILTSPPEAVSEGFVRELVGERYERALPFLSDELRERVTVDTLRAYTVRLLEGMDELRDVHGDRGSIAGDTAVAGATLLDVEGGHRTLLFRLERSGGVWSIATLDRRIPPRKTGDGTGGTDEPVVSLSYRSIQQRRTQ